MFVRVTPYKMKPGSIDAGKALLEQLRPQIMAMPGLVQFVNSVNEDGSGCVVAMIESREIAEANAEKVMAIWAQFAEHLEAVPTPQGYDVFANWSA